MSRRRLSVGVRFVGAITPRWAIVHIALAIVVALLAVAVTTVVSWSVDFWRIRIIAIFCLRASVVVAVGILLSILEASALLAYRLNYIVHFFLRCRFEETVCGEVDQIGSDILVIKFVEDWEV